MERDEHYYDGSRQVGSKKGKGKLYAALALTLPALLAGVFSLIPNLFDKVMSPKDSLSYSVIVSPSIKTASGYSKILSLTIENSGTTRITGIQAAIVLPDGAVERMSLGDSGGDRPKIGLVQDGGVVTVRSLFPKERIVITALANSSNPSARPGISVRSDQILGQRNTQKEGAAESRASRWAAFLAALGAALATLVSFFAFRSKREELSELYHARFMSTTYEDPIVDRKEVIMFISDMIGDEGIKQDLIKLNYDIMYVQFADMVAEAAYNKSGVKRKRMTAGLKSILLTPAMHVSSRKVIEAYLAKLGVSKASSEPVVIINDRLDFREAVRAVFYDNGIDVPLLEQRPVGWFRGWLRKRI